jgi:hypothetical protein
MDWGWAVQQKKTAWLDPVCWRLIRTCFVQAGVGEKESTHPSREAMDQFKNKATAPDATSDGRRNRSCRWDSEQRRPKKNASSVSPLLEWPPFGPSGRSWEKDKDETVLELIEPLGGARIDTPIICVEAYVHSSPLHVIGVGAGFTFFARHERNLKILQPTRMLPRSG